MAFTLTIERWANGFERCWGSPSHTPPVATVAIIGKRRQRRPAWTKAETYECLTREDYYRLQDEG